MMLKIKLDPGAYIPTRAHETDAGMDLYAKDDFTLAPRMMHTFNKHGMMVGDDIGALVDTGVHVSLRPGTFGLVAGRSGLNCVHSIIVPDGIIDSGYSGSIKVKMYNLGSEEYVVHKGDRIAQMIIIPCKYPEIDVVEELEETDRSDGGFGSTGV